MWKVITVVPTDIPTTHRYRANATATHGHDRHQLTRAKPLSHPLRAKPDLNDLFGPFQCPIGVAPPTAKIVVADAATLKVGDLVTATLARVHVTATQRRRGQTTGAVPFHKPGDVTCCPKV